MHQGAKLWERAINIIPGGNGLLSKRPERYIPDLWPTYYDRAQGCEIWDLDGNRYIDMAQMGIGTAILGYCNSEVDEAVKDAISKGVSTTLNAPEELMLAEKLLELNSFAGGVKFARTGGEAMAIAIRIARSYGGKSKVAFSGYHGWSDWYLSANLASKHSLDQHLLPGLSPLGVPDELVGTAIPFLYNNSEDLEKVIYNNPDIGTIVIEGARYDFPTSEFLSTIQRISKEKNVTIISDDITSGWRMTNGGVYLLNGFEPDIVVYGKAMGNGYAISAVVGKHEVMDCAQESFISSTFWTERIGFVAALKTIEIIEREKVWQHLNKMGDLLASGWIKSSAKHNLRIRITDFKPLITMKFDYGELNSAISTLFTQEMLERGYLAANSVYLSFSHNEIIINEYLIHVEQVFQVIAKAIDEERVLEKLKSRAREEGFKRLTSKGE
jgi:glutamate-1-semialdehyde 2,1-aminomutase